MATPMEMEDSGLPAPGTASSISGLSGGSCSPGAETPVSGGHSGSLQTPLSATSASHNVNSASKRPPRKSTLTQQQKNQKRQRATQDQLNTLELEFNKNPTPTANVRERIADEINMTERSVQIWFQNRRAKIKALAKKSLETGEDFDAIPESMRAYLAMQAMESGKGLGAGFLGRGLMPYGHGGMPFGGEQNGQGKVLIHHLTCRSLSVGKWTRVGQNTMDLIIFYSPDKCTMTYYINNEQAGYKIEYPFSHIKSIYLENNEGDPNKLGGIVIELNRPPNFFMDSTPNTNGFFQCGDFTEDQQASQCMVHHLGGNPKVLSGQLAKLVSLEAFMNRHQANPFEAMHAISMSAPNSPMNRPSSQPSFQPHVGMYQETQWGAPPPSLHAGMNRGHKRQRSRSVPMPVDFAMLQAPMPSFFIQHPGENPAQAHSPIFSPVPQQPGGMGPNLRIDTQAGFSMDMRQYPMSATTAPSPSDYSSPNYYSQGSDNTPMQSSSYNTPYGGSFLSPMVHPSPLAPQSVSPLSFTSHHHGDPAIVDQSPPMSMVGRPSSADLYPVHESAVSDDGTSLNDMYSKHSINLPMHPPHSPAYAETTQADMDMNQLVSFDHAEHASLSPEAL